MTNPSDAVRDALASQLVARLEAGDLAGGVLAAANAFLKSFPPTPITTHEVAVSHSHEIEAFRARLNKPTIVR
jgi:hypothetical protein